MGVSPVPAGLPPPGVDRARPMDLVGAPLPHPLLHRPGSPSGASPRRDRGQHRPSTVQRTGRVGEHQAASDHQNGVRVPRPPRAHRPGHARPGRAVPTTSRPDQDPHGLNIGARAPPSRSRPSLKEQVIFGRPPRRAYREPRPLARGKPRCARSPCDPLPPDENHGPVTDCPTEKITTVDQCLIMPPHPRMRQEGPFSPRPGRVREALQPQPAAPGPGSVTATPTGHRHRSCRVADAAKANPRRTDQRVSAGRIEPKEAAGHRRYGGIEPLHAFGRQS